MPLNFGLGENQANLQTADYKSAGSHQNEVLITFVISTADDAYHLAYTVPVDFTFYVSAITVTVGNGVADLRAIIAVGDAASEIDVFTAHVYEDQNVVMGLPTPIKFGGGTKISVKKSSNSPNVAFNLIGWIE